MKQVTTMFYGTISTDQSNRTVLESLNAEVGDYDARKGFFYVRASQQVLNEIEKFGDEFKGSFTAHIEDDDDSLRSVELMTTAELRSERARLEWLVHSEPVSANSMDSSQWIELWLDLLAKVTDRLTERSGAPSRAQRCYSSVMGM